MTQRGQGAELQRLMATLERKKKILDLIQQIDELMIDVDEEWGSITVYQLVRSVENDVCQLQKEITYLTRQL